MQASEDMIAIVEPMIPRLRRYARALLRDRDDADELVQDCLERAVSRWHLRRDSGSAHAWMFTILRNLALNRMRQRSRRGPHLSIDEDGAPSLPERPRQEDALHKNDILATLDRLPVEQKEVLLLVSVEDVSYAEAAEILGVPLGTVMSRLSRGRTRLREMLAENDRPTARNLRMVK